MEQGVSPKRICVNIYPQPLISVVSLLQMHCNISIVEKGTPALVVNIIHDNKLEVVYEVSHTLKTLSSFV